MASNQPSKKPGVSLPQPSKAPVQTQPSGPGFIGRFIRALFLASVLLLLGGSGFSIYNYSQKIDKKPWEWSGDDWNAWLSVAQEEGKQVGQQVVKTTKEAGHKAVELTKEGIEAVKAVDWAKVGNRITQKTKDLFGRTEEVAQKIEEQRKKTDTGEYAPKYSGEAGQSYEWGLQAMEEGLKYWKVSITDDANANAQILNPNATRMAKKKFEQAVGNFESAKKLDASLPLLDSFLSQAQDYLADSSERLQKIESLLQAQPEGAQPASAPTTAPAPAPASGDASATPSGGM